MSLACAGGRVARMADFSCFLKITIQQEAKAREIWGCTIPKVQIGSFGPS
jgi:hypothetical protein